MATTFEPRLHHERLLGSLSLDPQQHPHTLTVDSPASSNLLLVDNHLSSTSSVASSSHLSRSLTPTSASFPITDKAPTPDKADRRRSWGGRASNEGLTRQRSVGGGTSRSIKRTSRIGKAGFGPLLPVLVASMAGSQNETTAKDGEQTLGDTPLFQESAESLDSSDLASGLGIDGTSDTSEAAAQPSKTHARDTSEIVFDHHDDDESRTPNQNGVEPTPALPARQNLSRVRSISPAKTVPGLSGDVAMPSPPPSTADRINALQERHIGERPSSASPPGPSRKPSTGFAGLLGRMGSIRRSGKSPPAPRQEAGGFLRRTTSTSVDMGGGGGSLASITDSPEERVGRTVRLSLQDQFQNLRKQEEYGIPGANGHYDRPDSSDGGDASKRSSSGASNTSPPRLTRTRADSTASIKSPPMNPDLPPGTALGLTAGPAEQPRPVDWDMWQALVMEGPAVVTKSSGQELSQAIASGIPAAIRGVVWQVLAESKSDELEALYVTLKSKGNTCGVDSDGLSRRSIPVSRSESQSNISLISEDTEDKDGSQAASGPPSESATPPASSMISAAPSIQSEEAELRAKLLVEKQKRDAAALLKLEKAIKRDMGSRTSYSKYAQSAGLQDGLFGVCKAYALFDESVGYAQGINFIAMPLLFNMGESEAFALLVRLMSRYDVRSLFVGEMAGLHLRLYHFERLLEDHDPALYCHLKRRHVGPELYATQWFLTMFAYRFPLQLVLRVYDLVFSEGLTAVLKFGIVLLRRNRDALLEMKDMAQLTNFLKEKVFDVYIDKSPSASSLLDSGFFGSVSGGADKELYRADEMVRDACDIVVSETVLAAYSLEFEEQRRVALEKETELETLRVSNVALTARVKDLEQRTQQQDTEHVQIAGDLVRVKVENDGLHDEVEGLKIRNEELQKLVDGQPAEVEARLKEEMERIMQRNSEVQNENRALKEEMDETERALVDAKMQHAQMQSDHDNLRQRWSSVQAMLNDSK